MSFVCKSCGEAWERHPVTLVTCPVCKAYPGQWCKRPSGHDAAQLHMAREQAALDAGILKPCKLARGRHVQPDLFAQTASTEPECSAEGLSGPSAVQSRTTPSPRQRR